MIPSLLLALIIIASAAVTPCMAQDQTGISTNQTEALALRLYGWYKRSKERQAQLQTDITKLKNSINELQPSGPVTTAVAVGVTAEERQHLAELISDLQTEKERCKKMEDAWSKIRTTPPEAPRSFFWRYGPLSECQTASVVVGDQKPRQSGEHEEVRNTKYRVNINHHRAGTISGTLS